MAVRKGNAMDHVEYVTSLESRNKALTRENGRLTAANARLSEDLEIAESVVRDTAGCLSQIRSLVDLALESPEGEDQEEEASV